MVGLAGIPILCAMGWLLTGFLSYCGSSCHNLRHSSFRCERCSSQPMMILGLQNMHAARQVGSLFSMVGLLHICWHWHGALRFLEHLQVWSVICCCLERIVFHVTAGLDGTHGEYVCGVGDVALTISLAWRCLLQWRAERRSSIIDMDYLLAFTMPSILVFLGISKLSWKYVIFVLLAVAVVRAYHWMLWLGGLSNTWMSNSKSHDDIGNKLETRMLVSCFYP